MPGGRKGRTANSISEIVLWPHIKGLDKSGVMWEEAGSIPRCNQSSGQQLASLPSHSASVLRDVGVPLKGTALSLCFALFCYRIQEAGQGHVHTVSAIKLLYCLVEGQLGNIMDPTAKQIGRWSCVHTRSRRKIIVPRGIPEHNPFVLDDSAICVGSARNPRQHNGPELATLIMVLQGSGHIHEVCIHCCHVRESQC